MAGLIPHISSNLASVQPSQRHIDGGEHCRRLTYCDQRPDIALFNAKISVLEAWSPMLVAEDYVRGAAITQSSAPVIATQMPTAFLSGYICACLRARMWTVAP